MEGVYNLDEVVSSNLCYKKNQKHKNQWSHMYNKNREWTVTGREHNSQGQWKQWGNAGNIVDKNREYRTVTKRQNLRLGKSEKWTCRA